MEQMKRTWLFTEENDWEGELWEVYFESGEDCGALEELVELLEDSEPFALEEVDGIPDLLEPSLPDQCEYLEEDEEEDCGDCDYCARVDSYYPARQVLEADAAKVEAALAAGRSGDTELFEEILYKLGLFRRD